MKKTENKITLDIETLKKNISDNNLLNYIDEERMQETLTVFTFPTTAKDTLLDTDIMEDLYYCFIATFLKYQYKLPIKYLEPDIDSCLYISQKSMIANNSNNIKDAYISIEPLNQNIFKQISFTPINQAYDIGTIVLLHEKIPMNNSTRKLLTSASLECITKPKNIKYDGLCNRCIPYSSIDIGSEITGKFVVKENNKRESMTMYRFRRPKDNILEIITSDYLNVDCNHVLKLTKEMFIKDNVDKEYIGIIDKMMKL